MESVGIFAAEPSAIFLSPVCSLELLQLHADYHQWFDNYRSTESNYYLPGHWVPHCALTVNTKMEDAKYAVDTVLSQYKPFRCEVTEIGLVEFRPVRHLATIPLPKKPE